MEKKRFIHMTLMVIASFLVKGCGVYKGSFECKAGKGVGCESVSKVNELINEEKLDDFIEEGTKGSRSKNEGSTCSKKGEGKLDEVVEEKGKRNVEKFKIYFNEYRDGGGVIHKPSEVEVYIK